MIKKKGENGSALSLVLIFVTIAGLAIASLIFVTQISTTGVHQLSQNNKNSSDVSAANAAILARFQKDPTLGTAVYPAATDNCGLGQGFSLDPSLGVSFVSCIPVTGGAPFASTTVGTTTSGGTVGTDFGTTFSGTFKFDNALNSNSSIKILSGKVSASSAQENVTTNSSGVGQGSTPSGVTTEKNVTTPPLSPCSTHEDTCKLDISYWVDPHPAVDLPTLNCLTTDFSITLSPGLYTTADINALETITDPKESSKYKPYKLNSGGNSYGTGEDCENKGQKITIRFSEGEYIFSGNTTLTINNPNVTVRNRNTEVKVCQTGYDKTACADGIAADDTSKSWSPHTGVAQYSCDYDSEDKSGWEGPAVTTTKDEFFKGVRIFLDAVDLDVKKGTVNLCGTNFPTAKVLNNYAIIALDSKRVTSCKSHEKSSSRCPSSWTRSTYINFSNSAEVHIGGGIYTPSAKVTVSESRNKQHTWDREWTSQSMNMTCTYSAGCEHSIKRSEVGRTVELTVKDKDGHYISTRININDYDPTSVIKRKDNN